MIDISEKSVMAFLSIFLMQMTTRYNLTRHITIIIIGGVLKENLD